METKKTNQIDEQLSKEELSFIVGGGIVVGGDDGPDIKNVNPRYCTCEFNNYDAIKNINQGEHCSCKCIDPSQMVW